MKSIIFSVSLLIITVMPLPADVCGPLHSVIPTPEFFYKGERGSLSDFEREENLKQWQSLTSGLIPLADIKEAVYKDNPSAFHDKVTGKSQTDNLFYNYLNKSRDNETIRFLGIAKQLEVRWAKERSPWYYPASRQSDKDTGDYGDIINQCKSYSGKRLRDHYYLQITRALFASRQYADCIEFSDSAFSRIPDTNLMKRMAQRYVAGCWKRLGDTCRADSIFAKAGDILSLSGENPVEYMTCNNPDAPQIIDYIRCNASDMAFMRQIKKVAKKMINDRRVTHKGDWNFTLAYIEGELYHNLNSARKSIYRAMRQSFSTKELKDLARAYKMKLDGRRGNSKSLIADLKWIESKCDTDDSPTDEWTRICQNIIYAEWVPRLWKKRDYATAILLCSYADNLAASLKGVRYEDYDTVEHCWAPYYVPIERIRNSENTFNPLDYGCLSFQLMESLTSKQLSAVYNRILSRKPLYRYLRNVARSDRDYYYELIGTLALREENYPRAVKYLAKVSEQYLKTMNIDKNGYLSLDPFTTSFQQNKGGSNHDAKLKFAQRMLTYKRKMLHGRTADVRGLGRLMYAIGRWNSTDRCWALTQYWAGECHTVFQPSLQYWYDDFYKQNYRFIYEKVMADDYTLSENRYKKEVAAALAMLKSDEAKAKANYILGNLKSIVKYYGNTPIGQFVKTSCDNWRNWL